MATTDQSTKPALEIWAGPAVAGLSFLLFACFAARFPVIGVSSRILGQHLELEPFVPLTHPLWGVAVRAIDAVLGNPPAWVFNLFSAGCGAGAVWCLYLLSARYNLSRWPPKDGTPRHIYRGLFAAVCLAGCAPFLVAATRAHPATFDVFLLLASGVLLSQYHLTSKPRWLYLFGVLYGLGIVEYPAFIVWAPFLLFAIGLLVFFKGHLTPRVILVAALCLLVGLSYYFAALSWFVRRPAYAFLGDSGPLGTFRAMVGLEWYAIRHSLPQTGWLMVLVSTLVPWVVCLFISRHAAGLTLMDTTGLLHVVLTAVLVAVLVNAPIAPWSLVGPSAYMLMPYVLVASATGYMASFYLGLLRRRQEFKRGKRDPDARLIIAAVSVFLLVMLVLNVRQTNPRPLRTFYTCAEGIDRAMGSRTFLVTDGSLDTLVRFASRAAGRSLLLANGYLDRAVQYRKYLASHFEEPRLQGLAELGLAPLIRELLVQDPGITDRLALQTAPDPWVSAGYDAVPDRLLYLGTTNLASVAGAELMARNQAFAESLLPGLHRLEALPGGAASLARAIRWRFSSQINGIGLVLEKLNDPARADAAYALAYHVNPSNGVALLNRYVLGEADPEDPVFAPLSATNGPLQTALQGSAAALTLQYGHLRDEETFGVLAELTGLADQTASATNAASPLLQEAVKLFGAGETESARAKLDVHLREEPKSPQGWLLRGLMAVQSGDAQTWQESWEFMENNNYAWLPFILIRSRIYQAAKQVPQAVQMLQLASRLAPQNSQILEELSFLLWRSGDHKASGKYTPVIMALDPNSAWGNFSLGMQQYAAGDLDRAETSFRSSVKRAPTMEALNNLAWLLHVQGRDEEALGFVQQAFEVSSEQYQVLDTMGAVLIALDRLDEAEKVLTQAGENVRDRPAVLVQLAVLRLRQGRRREARELADQLESVVAEIEGDVQDTYQQLRKELDQAPAESGPTD